MYNDERDSEAHTGLPLVLAALMRDVMLARFSASCPARCGFIFISSAIEKNIQRGGGVVLRIDVMCRSCAGCLVLRHSLGLQPYRRSVLGANTHLGSMRRQIRMVSN